jgi:hypothetical protein
MNISAIPKVPGFFFLASPSKNGTDISQSGFDLESQRPGER